MSAVIDRNEPNAPETENRGKLRHFAMTSYLGIVISLTDIKRTIYQLEVYQIQTSDIAILPRRREAVSYSSPEAAMGMSP